MGSFDNALLSFTVVAAGALAQTFVGETIINTGGVEMNTSPSITQLGDGRFVVAWHDGGPTTAWARLFNAVGTASAPQFSLNPNTPSAWKYGPVTEPLPDGGIMSTWGYSYSPMLVQRFSPQFAPVGSTIGLDLSGNGNEAYGWPSGAVLSNGNIVVVGTDVNQSNPVMAIRYDGSLNPLAPAAQVNQSAPGLGLSAAVAASANSLYTVAWFNGAGNIVARTFDSSGTATGPEWIVNSSIGGLRTNPSLAYDYIPNPNGQGYQYRLWVAWESTQLGASAIYMRGFDSGGNPLAPEVRVSQSSGSCSLAQLASGGDGSVVVSYLRPDSSGKGVAARIFNSDGTPAANEFLVNQFQAGDQYPGWAGGRRGAAARLGRYFFAWRGAGAQGDGVYLTIFQLTLPVINGLSPTRTVVGSGPFTLTVNGTGFQAGSTVLWNGAALPTTFVSSNQLTVAISGSLVASAISPSITVQNPGAITSNAAAFGVFNGSPSVVFLMPSVGVGANQSFTFQFSHSAGYLNLNVMNALINSAVDGRQGCYVAYVLPSNAVYLVDDAGDAGGPYAGSLILNGSGSISNGHCTISGAGSSAVGSGNTLSLTLNIGFNSSFGGNKLVYAAARDTASANTGWQPMGVFGVSPLPQAFPLPSGMIPSAGTGANPALTFVYQDASSATNIQTAWALINTALDGRNACYVAYYQPGNLLFLIPDNGDGTQAITMSLAPGPSSISNSQCTISQTGSSVRQSGGQLSLSLNIKFQGGGPGTVAFAGPKAVWMAVSTLAGSVSPWQPLGVWLPQ